MKTIIAIFFPLICFSQQVDLLKSLDASCNVLEMSVSARLDGYKTKFSNGEPYFTSKESTVFIDEVGDFFYYSPYSSSEYLKLKKELDQDCNLAQADMYADGTSEIIYKESSNIIWHLMILNDGGEKFIAIALESK